MGNERISHPITKRLRQTGISLVLAVSGALLHHTANSPEPIQPSIAAPIPNFTSEQYSAFDNGIYFASTLRLLHNHQGQSAAWVLSKQGANRFDVSKDIYKNNTEYITVWKHIKRKDTFLNAFVYQQVNGNPMQIAIPHPIFPIHGMKSASYNERKGYFQPKTLIASLPSLNAGISEVIRNTDLYTHIYGNKHPYFPAYPPSHSHKPDTFAFATLYEVEFLDHSLP